MLNYAIKNGIINVSYVQEQVEMNKREEILKKHQFSIWYNEKEKVWYTHLPCYDANGEKKRVKRRHKKDLEDVIYQHYLGQDKKSALKNKENIEKMSLEMLFYEFMQYKAKEVSSGTIRRMMADWKRFYKKYPDFISMPFVRIRKIDIDYFLADVTNTEKLNKKAFYNMCGLLKQTLEYAEDAEYITKNPYRTKVNKKNLLNSKKKSNKTEVYQNDERELFYNEMERRIQNNPSNTAPLAVILDFELGARKGEILAISISDIVGNRIHIHRQVIEEFDTSNLDNVQSKGFVVVEYTKSEDGDRWIPLTQRAKEIIERVKKINKKYHLKYKDFLFVRDGKILSPDAIDCQVRLGCKHIGMPVKTMHKIRKTYASTLLHNGVNISIVKDMLGHADESTTLKHYIFNVENDETTENCVLNALESTDHIQNIPNIQNDNSIKGKHETCGTVWDSQVIDFAKFKKAKNLENTRNLAQ
ncbi:site-specific integrase [Mediterraneibacter sp. NSJ-55]|uniref:Site-specific integrase n=1 Tax=Mediterraneibacter hominis TaxID=2763054 RepID=A0A923LHC3_9FIRM|nr:site-specific integrase [Mediterraneibacter hominis]MBC5688071.1 site-specific integrase [Mediterraneibacter hominis]